MAANALEDLLPVAVAAIAGTGVVNVIRGLNAKKQAQALLAADPGVKDAAATLRAGVPDEANWGAISAGVESSLRDLSAKGRLSPEDLRRVRPLCLRLAVNEQVKSDIRNDNYRPR